MKLRITIGSPGDPSKKRNLFSRGKVFAVAIAAILAFLVATGIPLFRNTVLPAISPTTMIGLKIQLMTEIGTYLKRNLNDGLIYSGGNVSMTFRISNNSDYPLTIENIIMTATERPYHLSPSSPWQNDYVYQGGADVIYNAFVIKIGYTRGSCRIPMFVGAALGPNAELSRYRKIVHRIPPHETEYIPFVVECSDDVLKRLAAGTALGYVLQFDLKCVLKGKAFTLSRPSPVNVIIVAGSLPEAKYSDSGSNEMMLSEEYTYSGWYQRTAREEAEQVEVDGLAFLKNGIRTITPLVYCPECQNKMQHSGENVYLCPACGYTRHPSRRLDEVVAEYNRKVQQEN